MGIESSITYTVALATRRTLRPGQTSVSLLSLLARGSNQTNQTWVTLQDENKRLFVNSTIKIISYVADKGEAIFFIHKNEMHMGGCEG